MKLKKLGQSTESAVFDTYSTPKEIVHEGVFKGTKHPDFLIVGDMPYDEFSLFPFYNSHLSFLNQFLTHTGLTAGEVSTTNLFESFVDKGHYKPEVVREEKRKLFLRIESLAPKFIVFSGRDTFSGIRDGSCFDDERGYPSTMSFGSHTCLVLFTFHPRDIFSQPKFKTVTQNDFAKAFRLYTNGWVRPTYNISSFPSFHEAVSRLEQIQKLDCLISCDIETRGGFDREDAHPFITCIGFAWSETEAFVLPFHREGVKPLFNELEEAVLWKMVANILETKRLLGQNAVHYDSSVLSSYGINANFDEDTMFLGWSLWQELPKTLAFLASVYTDNPYHKDLLSDARKGRVDYKVEFYYCGLDCCVTLQVYNAMMKELKESRLPQVHDHYSFNIRLSRVFEYASRHGCLFDHAKRDVMVKGWEQEIADKTSDINAQLGFELNVSSSKQMNKLLYEDWKLPPKIQLVEDSDTGEVEGRIKSGWLEILYLSRRFPGLPLLRPLGELRKLKHLKSMIAGIGHLDSWCYWNFNTVGTETGRAAGKKPANGFGCQPQNPPRDKKIRSLWYAPEGWDFYKADLEGADSWTQAAALCAIGDERLMNDLKAGLKPAQALALSILYGPDVLMKTTQELITLVNAKDANGVGVLKSDKGKMYYAIAKAISHGSAYMMKENTMHSNIFKQSDGELYVEPSDCAEWQKQFFIRYNFPRLHQFMRGQLNQLGYGTSSHGIQRYFLGRRDDATLRAFLSFAPQANTGRGTNETMLNLFESPSNWNASNDLILHPHSQVHDEMDAIGRIEDRERIHELFVRSSLINQTAFGYDFVIPFAEDRGPNWGQCVEVN